MIFARRKFWKHKMSDHFLFKIENIDDKIQLYNPFNIDSERQIIRLSNAGEFISLIFFLNLIFFLRRFICVLTSLQPLIQPPR